MKTAIVIGAGWAGLSAAVGLAEKDFCVTVLEQSGRLGGRSSSFTDPKTGEIQDNGQHLFMGCYAHTIEFLKKMGTLDSLLFQKNFHVEYVRRDGRHFPYRAWRLPPPWHMAGGFLEFGALSWKDKWNMLGAFRSFENWNFAEMKLFTVQDWLVRYHQSEAMRKYFWDPLVVSALNEEPSRASANLLAVVMQKAYLQTRSDSCLGVSTVGLSDLCAPAEKLIEARNGKILRQSSVKKIVTEGTAVNEVILSNGDVLKADVVVSSVPFFSLKEILEDAWANSTFFAPIKKMESSPILSIHMQFDRDLFKENFVALLGTRTHWVSNRSAFIKSSKKGQISLTISAARAGMLESPMEITQRCILELHDCFPSSRNANLLDTRVIKERNATLSITPESEKWRPTQKTPIQNLYICGDWTNTGLPATIESAVLSGKNVANQL